MFFDVIFSYLEEYKGTMGDENGPRSNFTHYYFFMVFLVDLNTKKTKMIARSRGAGTH